MRQEINTRKGKRKFIRALCKAVANVAIEAVPRMPADWGGHELRELLADLMQRERMYTGLMQEDRRARRSFRKAYEKEYYQRNLP